MVGKKMYSLFSVTGVELEYMIVDKSTLAVKAIVDQLMHDVAGQYVSDITRGEIEWSNELVNHVLELKTNGPKSSLKNLPSQFGENVHEINKLLEKHHAMLLPTAAHPMMDPFKETVLWAHDNSEIYALYNRIFDCRGHGWSNLQSTHINLPFASEDEFAKLHAAIRLVLPIIPSLCASSPILDGKVTGFKDARMKAYLHHQEKIPSLTGRLIPEAVFSEANYQQEIFGRIKTDISPFDPEGIMDYHFMNSRGAIARFDRGSIEIRVMDVQECPAADVAIVEFINEVLKMLVSEKYAKLKKQQQWHENDLFEIFYEAITNGEDAIIANENYLQLFGVSENSLKASELWKHLLAEVREQMESELAVTAEHIITAGTLSSRILKRLSDNVSPENIREVYKEIARCLHDNRLLQ